MFVYKKFVVYGYFWIIYYFKYGRLCGFIIFLNIENGIENILWIIDNFKVEIVYWLKLWN